MNVVVSPGRELDRLVGYLRPALDELRRRDSKFESYLLEMVILALEDQPSDLELHPALIG